jgi:8-oxo-dGTP pyrophosphatase MutT (NUDIX family)
VRQSDGVDEIKQLATREVYRSKWMRVREDVVQFPSGAQGTYSVVEKRDFVLVIPYENDGFWLVEQYRYPVGTREWEFPQGGWPAGADGTQEELAVAELREETGHVADSLVHLGRLHTAYGFCAQGYDVYLATGLTPGEVEREVTEEDMIHEWRSAADVREMIRTGELRDAHSLAALALFDLQQPSPS